MALGMEEDIFNTTRAFIQTRKHYGSSYIIRLGIFTITCLLLLTTNYINPHYISLVRQHLNDQTATTVRWLHKPQQNLQNFLQSFSIILRQLRQPLSVLDQTTVIQEWQLRARSLAYENKKLKKSLKFIQGDHVHVATAHAFLNKNGRHLQALTIDAGTKQGLKVNQPVIANGRLIGRIIETSLHSSLVLLITDGHSRIPIETEWSQARAILTGNNTSQLTLLHEREPINFLKEELAFTTGEGGIYPPGYIIGKISINEKNSIIVDPMINWEQIDVVQIITNIDAPMSLDTLILPSSSYDHE